MYQIARYTDENIGGTGLMWDILANEQHQVKKVLVASSRSIYSEGTYHCTANCGNVVPLPRSRATLDQPAILIMAIQLGRSHRSPPSIPRLATNIPRRWLESIRHLGKTQEIYEDRSKAATQELKQRNL